MNNFQKRCKSSVKLPVRTDCVPSRYSTFIHQMDRLEFYKEMFFRETELKHKLDEKISMPTGMLTIVVAVHVFFFSNHIQGGTLNLMSVIAVFAGVALGFCLFYIAKSMFNFGNTRKYKELNAMNEYRKYDLQLKQHNREKEYEDHLEAQFADGASVNGKINIERTEAMAYCKVCLFFCLVFTFINALVYVYTIAVN